MDSMLYIAIAAFVGIAVGLLMSLIYKSALKGQKTSIEAERNKIIENAKKEAENIKKESMLEAKDIVYQAKTDAEKELRERRSDVNQLEKRMRQKE